MKTLISLEQYVDDQSLKFASDNYKSLDVLCEIFQYTNTLKQQPQLNHFIPCVEKDGKWEVVEKPNNFDAYKKSTDKIIGLPKFEEYLSASKNVLFDGWEVKMFDIETLHVTNGVVSIFWYNSIKWWYLSKGLNSYSDLTKYNLPLTDNGEIYFNIKN